MGNWNIEHDITIDINYQFNDHFILCHSSINIVQGNHTFDVYTKYWFHTGLVDAIDNSIRKSLKLLLNHHYLHQSKIIVYTPIKSGLYKIQTISSKNIMKIVQFLNLSYSTIYVKHIERYTYTNQVDVSRIKISFKYYAKSKINEIIKSHLNESMVNLSNNCNKEETTTLINHKNFNINLVNQEITSLCTGHGPTRAYLFNKRKIGLSANCPVCNSPQNYSHITTCPMFDDIMNIFEINGNEHLTSTIGKLLNNNKLSDFSHLVHRRLRDMNERLKFII